MAITMQRRYQTYVLCALSFMLAQSVLFECRAGDDIKVSFQHDIQPILAEHCFRCHGVDASSRQSGLRLDSRDDALKGGDSGEPAIVPGQAQRSQLIQRVSSQDADTVMPPPEENQALSADQIAALTRWIQQGADYTSHWAFTAPKKAELTAEGPYDHPIDQLVAAKLRALDLEPAPKADDATLCRRVYLDLIGLPPSPQQLDAFQRDGFAATVESLLASEHFGEKWGRHWLDVARYSDTNGYEKDLRREQWAWRDWVIDALNRDMPYDQFLIEQIAGDLFVPATQKRMVATGFLRNSMLNEEGAIVPEQFRMFEMFDRMDCIGKSILGLTIQCAQCHSHKFDPITQDEYYGMFSLLNNTYEAKSPVYTAEQQQQIDDIMTATRRLNQRVQQQHPEWQTELAVWQQDVLKTQGDWMPLDAIELGSLSGLNHPVQLADKSLLMLGHTSTDIFILAQPQLHGVTGLRLEVLNHGDLPYRGPGRSETGGWATVELEVFVQRPSIQDWEKVRLTNATADFSEPEQKQPDGKATYGPVGFLIDGSESTSWRADRGLGRRNQPSVAVLQFEQPLDLPAGTRMKVALRMTDMLGCIRISTTQQPHPVAAPVDYAAVLSLQTPAEARSPEQHDALFAAWRRTLQDCEAINNEIAQLWNRYPAAQTTILHFAERPDCDRRVTHALDRGEWDRPLHPVSPHTPAFLHPLPDADQANRLTFARWLASDQSPLTARVAVNRVWQVVFGAGLVATPEDFGTRAPAPEHLQLLDWLAVDFMEHGWSQKHLIRTIVSSATYRQDSHVSSELLERDPQNRLLARGPRFRAEAEVVRDIALCAAGLLTHRLGGPPSIPPVPQNVLDYNYVYPSYWTAAQGPDRYRRAIYGFRKRSMPDPVMSNFDGPNGDTACARRVRSNTPLAALTGLNETIFFEAAQAMALRILRDGGTTDCERADFAFRLCTSRLPVAAERDEILSLLNSRRQRLAEGWLNAREIATGDARKLPELPAHSTPQDAAAWTLVSRVLLNLDETITNN
jgi:mono/diheme cytochrome c family protein